MPDGVTLGSIFAVLIPVGIVTVLLRWLPFGFVKALKGSQFISMLGFTMPVGVMTVLVVYTLFGQIQDTGSLIPPSSAQRLPQYCTCGAGTRACPSSVARPCTWC